MNDPIYIDPAVFAGFDPDLGVSTEEIRVMYAEARLGIPVDESEIGSTSAEHTRIYLDLVDAWATARANGQILDLGDQPGKARGLESGP